VPGRLADGRFRFAVGIEDTFVPQVPPGRRALDEYELTQHYHYWRDDLRLARETGATTIRYGIPWYRIEPEPGRFAWRWLDAVVDRIEELGLEPILDLVHYGTPLWLDNQFANHDYPRRVAAYAAAVADRYRGRVQAYTPLNEPLVNVAFCGESGVWPPHLTGDDGYVQILRAIARGIVETQRAIGEATFVHVEAVVGFVGAVDEHRERIEFLERRALLVEDLLTGRVDDDHPLAPYLRANGFRDDDFAWFAENTAPPDVMGVNYYPHLSTAELVAGQAIAPMGPVTPQPKETGGLAGLEQSLRLFWERYGRPVFLTETSMVGEAERRVRWLDESVELLFRLRDEGVDVVGYTWWPLFHFVDWAYRESSGPAEDYLVAMGLYDLVPDDVGVLERVRTAAVDRFREHTERAGAAA
jgi:beta-glucosidase/6-phospho-beta-glucosidase/beta-galactosidase